MKILHTKKQLPALFIPGFLIGILYANFIVNRQIASPDIFSEYFLKQYAVADIVPGEYFFYLIRVRLVPFFLVFGLAFTKFRKLSAWAVVLWTGFSGGMILTMASVSVGIKGILLCIIGILPQFLLYIPAYAVLVLHCLAYPKSRWNSQKTFFILGMTAAGILLELYVNPLLVRGFLKIM